MNASRWLALCLTIALLAQPALGANKFRPAKSKASAVKPTSVKPAPAPLPSGEQTPPYEAQLLRLSDLMGALTYVRDLCHHDDGPIWRAKMAAVIEAESSTSPGQKEKLAGAYNKGFRGYEITYHTCTPNASLIIARYLDEGTRLAHDISNRYGGG